ncbi:hypothetical protein [Tenacibaculum sp. C7A-26P2]|uniref:hypothetical protein n=1 Tax=Tenacibaculum sp. C7A-26P2 TaxID=3447504 RepID=UPI003F85754A
MKKLNLHYGKIIQGNFNLNKINFLFIFQVNCPGCFIYGIPIVNKLYEKFKDKVSFIGISTAFEDFNYNTAINTKKLIEQGETIGETRKVLKQHGFDNYPHPINFPVAFDKIVDENFNFNEAASIICKLHPEFNLWPEFEKKTLHSKVYNYLKSLDSLALTFVLNQFKGTPTMVIFNDSYEILFSQFGHVNYDEVESKLISLITKFT